MKSLLISLCIIFAVISVAAADSEPNPQKLKVALLPDESAATVIKNNQALKQYLQQQTGKDIELVVTTYYSSMIEAMRHGRIDVAFFGPLSYVLAKQKSNIEPFAALQRKGTPTYQGVIIAHVGSGIDSLKDIKGKNMAFGDPASTSAHLVPKSMLVEVGLKAKTDYQEHFLGSHDAVALTVQNGKADAGGLSKTIFEALVDRGVINKEKVKVVAESKHFPEYPWTMRSNLAPELKDKIRSAYVSLKDVEVLKPFKADGFAAVSDKDYDVVRNLAGVLNLDLAKMK